MGDKAIEDFKKSSLTEYVFPGTDAAVVFVAEGTRPSNEVQEVLGRSRQQRWFPVDGGNNAKVPFHLAKGCEHLFERETKGWDHEHCDFCNTSVRIGELCWTAPSGSGILIFCKECYSNVPN
jgi:hypothetical protein